MKNVKQKMEKEKERKKKALFSGLFLLLFFLFSCNNFVTDILPERHIPGAPVERTVVVGLPAPDSITVEKVALLDYTGQSVEYAVATSNNADPNSLSWQPQTTFTGLCSGTGYYVYTRSAATPNYDAGPVTVSDYICFYTVYFNANDQHGGEPPCSSQTALENSIVIIPGWGNVHRTDSVPGSWNTEPDGRGINYIPGQPYKMTDDEELYIRWFAGQTPVFIIDLIDDSAPFADVITVSQTGSDGYPMAADMTISNYSEFTGVSWRYNGAEISTGETCTVNATDISFNEPGTHTITIIGYKGGLPFSRTVSFVVVP